MQVVKGRFMPAVKWEKNSERYLRLSGVAFSILMFN
jgi:hypothetical protein